MQRVFGIAAKGAAHDKSPVQELSKVRIRARDGSVGCDGTNISSSVSASAAADVIEPGDILAPKDFLDRVSSMGEGALEISTVGADMIVIASPGLPRRFQMSGMSAAGWKSDLLFPAGAALSIPRTTLLALFSAVESVVSSDDATVLNNASLTWKPGSMTIAATDSHRLTFVTRDVDDLHGSGEVLIRRNDIHLFLKILESTEAPTVEWVTSSKMAGIRIFETEAIVRLTDGQFPPFLRVVPQEWKRRFRINREALARSLQSVTLSDKREVFLTISDDGKKLSLATENVLNGGAEDEVDILSAKIDKNVSMGCKLKVSPPYMRDAIGSFDSEDVTFCTSGDGMDNLIFARPDEGAASPALATHIALMAPMR